MVGFAVSSVLRELFSDWRNPNGSEAHSLDVVQLTEAHQHNTTTCTR